jgi:CheY-like chemotaxis protein
VGLRSRPGRGTAVWLVAPASARPCAARAADPASRPTDARTGSPTVVVVDDDEAVREGIAALLQRWGHRTLAGAGTVEVLRRWHAAGRPALAAIVADWHLADDGTGADAIAALRAQAGAGVPALLVSGDTGPATLAALGASGLPWLSKPVAPVRLRSWLQTAAAGARD